MSIITRRQLLAWAAAAGPAAIVLAACGNESSPTGATREVYSNNGPILVPANPQRVVAAIGSFDIDILAVGVVPVLTTTFAQGWANVPDSVVITSNIPPTPEELLALKPDVMIGWNWVTLEPAFDELNKIAPYVGLGEEQGTTWRKLFVQTCDVVNRKSQAEGLLDQLDQRAAGLKSKRDGRPPIRVARIEFYESGTFSWRGGADTEITAELMEAIGIEVEPYPADIEDRNAVSLERLSDITADWLVIPAVGEYLSPEAYLEVQQLDLWKSIPAVKAGQVIEVDGDLWPGFGYLFADALLTDLDEKFVKAGL